MTGEYDTETKGAMAVALAEKAAMLQLTWENNYKAAGEALGEDLTTDPSVVATDPDLAARTAAWFFSNKGLNEVADQGQIGRVTLLINGGYNGIDDRLAAYDRAMKALAPPEQPLALPTSS